MDKATFVTLPRQDVAALVNERGPKVVAFPINGTRRWYLLEHGELPSAANWQRYMDITQERHIAIYTLLFEHGIQTVLAPMFGPDLLERGEGYMGMAAEGLRRLAEHPSFTAFYAEYDVRVRFYGDYARKMPGTPLAPLLGTFQQVAERSAARSGPRLLYGVFGNDPTEQVAALGAQYYAEHGTLPNRDTLVSLYYGERLAPVDIFIGFDRLAAFDMPLLTTGEEDLYFTVSPSLYLDETQLRDILYDALFTRQQPEPAYDQLTPAQREAMRTFYRANRHSTIGVGKLHPTFGLWVPLPAVTLPQSHESEDTRHG